MGVKETKEFLEGNLELLVFLIGRLKDGADLADAIAIFQALATNDEFQDKMTAAYEGVVAIDDELNDLSLSEGVDIVNLLIAYIPRLVEAAKS